MTQQNIYVYCHTISQKFGSWVCSPDRLILRAKNGGLSYSFQLIQNQN